MPGIIASLVFLIAALIGYFFSIKPSKLEREIRKQNLAYKCFECNEEFSVNETKCPKCSFITLYGKRKEKYWVILPILGVWIFLFAKFLRRGLI